MQDMAMSDKVKASSIKLTPRGREVFMLILKGITDKHIASLMGISYSAVRRHKEKMLFQNDCYSMLELISKHYARPDSHWNSNIPST
jgi:DNA-binding CsgD family transcriptional regulator